MPQPPFDITQPLHRPATAEVDGSPRDAVPTARSERDRLRDAVRQYTASHRPTPPFSVDELRQHSDRILAVTGAAEKYRKFIAVLLSNEAWRRRVAAVPFERRLLLLPKCLRSVGQCGGSIDALGLVCGDCGRCPIHDLKTEAERLGYVVLIAEGTPAVMTLMRSGRIEAVVGVSCLSALESIYPLMEAAAIPGIAIPLLQDGCENTTADVDWVREAILMTGAEAGGRLDLEALRAEVDSWFTPEALEAALGPDSGETERIARAWLARAGKRWRPLLAACAYQAFHDHPAAGLPENIRRIALAVECFHKASLVHDDIEDADETRYGQPALHHQYGVAVALNVGDFLLGEGYRLVGESGATPEQEAEMLRAAAHGHRELTIGQGSELCWARRPRPLSPNEVIDIFRLKTAPAFEVALRLGALAAGAGDEVWAVLHRYSEALGIAYQIHDDLADWQGDGDPSDALALRPSILLALAYERARGGDRDFFDAVWRRTAAAAPDEVRRRLEALGVEAEARRLMAAHEEAAIRSLEPLTSTGLKALLRRVLAKIFRRFPQGGLPGEPEAGHAARRGPDQRLEA